MKMITKNIFNQFNPLIVFAALMLCASCQKASLTEDGSSEGYVIRYLPSVSLLDDSAADQSSTKGELINRTGNDIAFPSTDTFKVSAWTGTTQDFGYEEVVKRTDVKGNDYWITVFPTGHTYAGKDKEHIWKKDETKTFYAYANLPTATGSATVANTASTGQTLTYDLSKVASADSQKDILLGSYNGTGNKGVAKITFKHPLTAVGFIVDDIGDEKIKGITVSGLHKTGSVQMSSTGTIGTWTSTDYTGTTSQSTTSDDGLTLTALGEEGSPELLGTWFLLIPQEITSTNKVTVTVTFASGDTASAELSSGTWSAGKTNLYKLSYSGAATLSLTLAVIDWKEVENDTDLDSGNILKLDPKVNQWDDEDQGKISYTD